MNYFSPHLLDGSVTTVKLAADAVTRSRINLASNSAAGDILAQSLVTIPFDSCSFIPGIESDIAASPTVDVQVVATRDPFPAPNPNAPTWDLRNERSVATVAYAMAWLYIDV